MRCEDLRASVGTDGIYVISLCPPDYTASCDVKQACETDVADDIIHQVPVSGGHSPLVYRNIYCAACHDEPSPRFWLVALADCGRGDCKLAFHPDSDEPRSCLQEVSRCAADWQNTTLAGMCRQSATSLLTDGQRVFRNGYCARCHDVDDAQLRCVQVPPPPPRDAVAAFNATRYDVIYDLNAAASRCHADQLYDPLSSRCVSLPYCAASWPNCRRRRPARHTTRDCRLAANSSDLVRHDNCSVYVCTADQSATPGLMTLFRLHDDVQRLVSIVATVVGLSALVGLLSSYCLLVDWRRADNTSKMAVCFVASMLLYHVVYLFVLAASRLRSVFTTRLPLASLVVCAGLQYFAMTAFFWLHVLSIEAFRAVRRWCVSDVPPRATSCTALFVYSLYAWCVPLLLVAWSVTSALQSPPPPVDQSCCVVAHVGHLLLFVVPAGVSLLVDAVLYALTALMLCRRRPHAARRRYDTDTLLPDRHSAKLNTDWTTRSWSVERLRAERRAVDALGRRWNDIYVTCMQTSLLLASTWTLVLLPATGWSVWPHALWYVYVVFDLALVVTVCLSWCGIERVWHVLATRKRNRCHDDDPAAAAAAAAAGRGGRATGRRTPPAAFTDAGDSLRLLVRETSI